METLEGSAAPGLVLLGPYERPGDGRARPWQARGHCQAGGQTGGQEGGRPSFREREGAAGCAGWGPLCGRAQPFPCARRGILRSTPSSRGGASLLNQGSGDTIPRAGPHLPPAPSACHEAWMHRQDAGDASQPASSGAPLPGVALPPPALPQQPEAEESSCPEGLIESSCLTRI